MSSCLFILLSSFHSAITSNHYKTLTNTTLPGCADGAQLGCKLVSCNWPIGIAYLKTDGNSFNPREINKVKGGITVIALKGTVNIVAIADWLSGKRVAAVIV